MQKVPQVSVLVAVHNGERFLRPALESISSQTFADFELVVVDDGSSDSTPSVLDAYRDSRLNVVRNEDRRGLAGALNRGLDEVRGRYVARMDADDIAFPFWLERVLGRIRAGPQVALVGAGVIELESDGRLGAAHVPQSGRAVTRWHSLFSASPFFHNTVVLDNELARTHSLRYDESFGESEDYELWTRVLEHAEADALDELLVFYRLHPEQASQRRAELQLELGRRIALQQIARVAPTLTEGDVDLAWRFGYHRELEHAEVEGAADAYLELVARFLGSGRYARAELDRVREAAARLVARRAREAPGAASGRLLGEALRLDPLLAVHTARRRARRAQQTRLARQVARPLLRGAHAPAPIRVVAVFPEPTPYRTPLLDRVAALDELELTVVYAAESVVAGRSWAIDRKHDSVVLRGIRAPGGARVFRHDYPVTPGIVHALRQARPDVVVVSGWSTFAAQATIAWCRARGVPYLLVVESHDEGPRPGWRRRIKSVVVPPIVGGAVGILVTGSLARTSMIERGAPPGRIRVFANTVDVEAFGERADRLAERRAELREGVGASGEEVVVLSVARLGPEKRLDALVRAVEAAADSRLIVVIAGEGQERGRLADLAADLDVRLVLTGDVPWERIVELYAAADVFALLSERETWGVVVNEAAACGLPLVLSDRVGAAHDLLRDGQNGMLVPAGDVQATAQALRELAADPCRRRAFGARSRELARDWGYGPSVEGFLAAVREAVADRRR